MVRQNSPQPLRTAGAGGDSPLLPGGGGRRKRARGHAGSRTRAALNTVFLLLAAVGLAMYFFGGENHVPALCVIAAGMALKVVEFILRLV